MKKTIAITALITTLGFSVATPALAWGEREQGILTGIVGLHIWNKLHERSEPQETHSRHSRHPQFERMHDYRPHPSSRSHIHRPVVVYQEPIIIHETHRIIEDSTKSCRLVPVKNETGRILEFRTLCD
jgi:hypothetical protein